MERWNMDLLNTGIVEGWKEGIVILSKENRDMKDIRWS